MRKLAYLGVASLMAVALLGTSCSSDDNPAGGTGGSTAATGGSTSTAGGTTGTGTGTKATGGSTGTSTNATGGSTAPAGGTTGVGGVTGVGGTTAPSTADASIVPVTGGLDITGNFYETGTFKGTMWKAADKGGSWIEIAAKEMCVTGLAIKIPNLVLADGGVGTPDYSGAWGVNFGFNLNQVEGVDGGNAGAQNPADVSDVVSVTVGMNGATGLALRVQLEVKPDADAGTTDSTYYCAQLASGGATVDLTKLKTNCWTGGSPQNPFDPLTMKPSSVAIAAVTSTSKEYPINFCVTDFHFNTDQ